MGCGSSAVRPAPVASTQKGGDAAGAPPVHLSVVTATPPQQNSTSDETLAHSEAQTAFFRRHSVVSSQNNLRAGLHSLQRALQTLADGKPSGFASPSASLEMFIRTESLPVQTGDRMRKALAIAETNVVEVQDTADPNQQRNDLSVLTSLDAVAWDRFAMWCREHLLLEAFRHVDLKENSKLSAQELMVLLMLISVQRKEATVLKPEDAEQIVQEFDVAGDGHLNEAEFLGMFHHLECELVHEDDADRMSPLSGPAAVMSRRSSDTPPHLVLYFDVNNTVLISDTLTGKGPEDLLTVTMAGCAWGIRARRDNDAQVWLLVCPEPRSHPPWDGLISYAEFVADTQPMPSPRTSSPDEIFAAKERRRETLRSFCNPGSPGEALRPHLDKLLADLRRAQPLEAEPGRSDQGPDAAIGLLPSFYYLLQKLKGAGRSFTVVFRTFGIDLDERMQSEFNAFCEGKHPLFSDGPVLDGSDGGLDHRMDLTDHTSVGTFFRNPEDGAISLIWGTHEQPPAGSDLSFYDGIPGAEVFVGAEKASQALLERVLKRSNTVVMRDYYPGWAKAQFSGMGGKPFFLHIEDDVLFPIFFDDNIRPVDPTIVDTFDVREYPQRIPTAQVFDIHLVRVTSLRSISEMDYFWTELIRCEAAKARQLERRRKVARMLHDTAAVRRVIVLLRGAEVSESEESHTVEAKFAGTVKFTPWRDLEVVRHCAPLTPEATEPPVPPPDVVKRSTTKCFTGTQPPANDPVILTPSGSVPVKYMPEQARRCFIREEWEPFLERLESHLDAVLGRHRRGFSSHEVMPPQAAVSELAESCLALTEQWHGRPNASAFYDFFMKAAESDGQSPYLFRDLPQERSADGFVRVLDGQARKRLYSGGAHNRAGHAATPPDLHVGSMPQAAGESAIDNLVLPHLVRRQQALRLRVGRRIQQYFVRVLQRKQHRILSDVGLLAQGQDPASLYDGHVCVEEVRRLMQLVGEAEAVCSQESFLGANTAASTSSFAASPKYTSLAQAMLADKGRVIESYGQLPEEVRTQFEAYVAAKLKESEKPEDELDPEVASFLEHCASHPGRAYRGSPVDQKLMILRAIASPGVRVLWRSETEQFVQHRYFATPWVRAVPLLALPATPPTDDRNQLVTLRPEGTAEHSRFRKNVFAYGEEHGLGQCAGGCAESPDWPPGTLMYEFGTLLCVDEAGKLPNHAVTDIEKIVRDAVVLCPEGGTHTALPGESLHDTGQNPIIAASIGATQHVQVMRATSSDFPLVAESNAPRWYRRLEAWLDVVQVGASKDAFFVQARSRHPDATPLLSCLVDLRAQLLRAFGHGVDFSASCHPTEGGEFLVCLAPVACMRKVQVPTGTGCLGLDFDFENPDTSERLTQQSLPVVSVDCSHGKGNVLAVNDQLWRLALEGRPMLARLYDFNRKLGARAVVEDYLQGVECA